MSSGRKYTWMAVTRGISNMIKVVLDLLTLLWPRISRWLRMTCSLLLPRISLDRFVQRHSKLAIQITFLVVLNENLLNCYYVCVSTEYCSMEQEKFGSYCSLVGRFDSPACGSYCSIIIIIVSTHNIFYFVEWNIFSYSNAILDVAKLSIFRDCKNQHCTQMIVLT